ncbi:alpha/beta fold hydrolase [Nocardia sp. NPDC051929]|uniref:alpha/beta fold hydrolase n=1 Tax=unclassified Nocardia TaxID=2637762 RepID=UPI003425EEFE
MISTKLSTAMRQRTRMTSNYRAATAILNETELHYETRGDGPPILFISGAFGDAGGWEAVSESLSETNTVITYDRRGNSRSPAPDGWTATSLHQQAGDAAALLEFLDVGPAAVWANSLGGAIGLNLALQRPDLVRLAVLHEPFLAFLLEDPTVATGPMLEAIAPFLAAGDYRGGAEAMLRLVAGSDVYDAIAPALRDRMLGNAATLFNTEFPGLSELTAETFQPQVPLTIAIGAESPSYLTAGAHRLADLLHIEVHRLAGAHVPHVTHPDIVVALCRQLLAGAVLPGPTSGR